MIHLFRKESVWSYVEDMLINETLISVENLKYKRKLIKAEYLKGLLHLTEFT